MKIYILVIRSIKDKQWTQNYIPDSCYINKDNAVFIQNKMKKDKGWYAKIAHETIFKKTSIGRNPSTCKMNKHKRRQFKKYNGQGK